MAKLEVICGPMFAGKTEELIRRVKRAALAEQNIRVFKPGMDYRYGVGRIMSHAKTDLEVATGIKPEPVFTQEEPLRLDLDALDLVGFDEVQFFNTEWLEKEIDRLIGAGVRVICAGLDLDSFGKPFGALPMVLAKADDVTKLKAICVICRSDANRTYRKVENKEVNFIGGTEAYEPRCQICWEG